jgi:Dynamin family
LQSVNQGVVQAMTAFSEQFDQHGEWRRGFAWRLRMLADWMRTHDLLDSAVQERLRQLESNFQADKVMVAFVAEFSRGKSELINAIFFAAYGRRIIPASAGRTTMCPTELAFDEALQPCLRLLPIETRLQTKSLMDWRKSPEKWVQFSLDVSNPQSLADALSKVSETQQMSQEDARALGIWPLQGTPGNVSFEPDVWVEVPKWRHALVNLDLPLLRQGLVILDTPGMNAIGAEPELTVNLLPQAHAVVFILAADIGVSSSDLEIWREHLVTDKSGIDTRLVVLNKIDTLWDALSTPAQIQDQMTRQCASTAQTLGIDVRDVYPVSAQKGLVAKVSHDEQLLQASLLPVLEHAMTERIMERRRHILRSSVSIGIADLQSEVGRLLNIRRRDLAEQMQELNGLRGKNQTVIQHMRLRVSQEQAEFDRAGVRIHAVRSVHLKLLQELFDLLGPRELRSQMAQLIEALKQSGVKVGVKKSYAETFANLRARMQRVQDKVHEIQNMLSTSFRELNTEYGFSLQPQPEPQMDLHQNSLDQIEQGHLQYMGIANVIRLNQPDFTERLASALGSRVREVYQAALEDVEAWSKSAAAQIDTHMRERRRNFSRRLDAINRIHQASDGLQASIEEIEEQAGTMAELDAKLLELTQYLIHVRGRGEEAAGAALSSAPLPLATSFATPP